MAAPISKEIITLERNCKDFIAAVGSEKLTEAQLSKALELIEACNRVPNSANNVSLAGWNKKIVNIVQAQGEDRISQKAQAAASKQLAPVSPLLNLLGECYTFMHQCPQIIADEKGGKGIDIESLKEEHIQKFKDYLAKISQFPSAAKDPQAQTWIAALQDILKKWGSVVEKKQQSLIDECSSYMHSLPKKEGKVLVSELTIVQIQVVKGLLSKFSKWPLTPQNKSLEQWKSPIAQIIHDWEVFEKNKNQSQAKTPAPPASASSSSALTNEKRMEAACAQLLDRFDLSKAQALLKELESTPKLENVDTLKAFVTGLIQEKTKVPTSSSSLSAVEMQNGQWMKVYKNPFEASHRPVGIKNEGNTCFAAAWMQLVCMNTVLSGAYQTLLPKGHYARNIVDNYQKQQISMSEVPVNEIKPMDGIEKMRAAFGDIKSKQQQDAVELCRKVNDLMTVPQSGEVLLENQEKAVFMHSIETFLVLEYNKKQLASNKQQLTYDKRQLIYNKIELTHDERQVFFSKRTRHPIIDLDLTGKTTDLAEIMKVSLNYDSFFENPNVMLLNKKAKEKLIDLPLFFEIPNEQKIAGLAPQLYTLQGFLTHFGSENGGHYIAHHQWRGKFYKANDEVITEVSQAEYLQAAKWAYMPLYTKVIPRGLESLPKLPQAPAAMAAAAPANIAAPAILEQPPAILEPKELLKSPAESASSCIIS